MGQTPPPRRGSLNIGAGTWHEYAPKRTPKIDYGDIWQGTPEIDRRLRVILGEEPELPPEPMFRMPPNYGGTMPLMGHATGAFLGKVTGLHGTTCCYVGHTTVEPWEEPSRPLRLLRE